MTRAETIGSAGAQECSDAQYDPERRARVKCAGASSGCNGIELYPWDAIDYEAVVSLYNTRHGVHQRLLSLFKQGSVDEYVELALGIKQPDSNYSASDHGLGPRILEQSPPQRVFQLAEKLFRCHTPDDAPQVVYGENIPYLKISVGSEMGALLKPDVFWVTNVRTIWAHLVMKHNDVRLANEELTYYRTGGMPSEMEYQLWRDIHTSVGESMRQLAMVSREIACRQGCQPNSFDFLWSDAIADQAYTKYARRRARALGR